MMSEAAIENTGQLTTLGADGLAAIIVTLMLIPQSLAYAMLAGLPPQVGLIASMLPLIAYAIFGSSRTLAVGPVAILSLMTAEALGGLMASGTDAYLAGAMVLALISGGMLLAMGLLRMGFVANFISHSVITGFMAASAILIGVGQLKHIFGISISGQSFPAQLQSLLTSLPNLHWLTLFVGGSTLAGLIAARSMKASTQGWFAMVPKFAPIIAVVGSIVAATTFGWTDKGVAVVGTIPEALPRLILPSFDPDLWLSLLLPAAAITAVGFVETVSVAQTLAARRRETIYPNRELVGLGAANLASGLSGGFPVTGGLSRSAVAFDAGARTRLAGVLTAVGIALVAAFITPFLRNLPIAVLAATIIVAVASLVDVASIKRAARYSKSDFAALMLTLLTTLLAGVVLGLLAGIALSLAVHLYKSSRPHMAVVGRVPDTEHFRNVERHTVKTYPGILSLRVDESLFFANARGLEAVILDQVAQTPDLRHFILMCPAINRIDLSALESLERINEGLRSTDIELHLSEVKGPVMDRLQRSNFLEDLSGQVFLTQLEAVASCQSAIDRLESSAQNTEG